MPPQTDLYSATAAVVVQSRLREPTGSSVCYFASFYVRQEVLCIVLGPVAPDPGDTTTVLP